MLVLEANALLDLRELGADPGIGNITGGVQAGEGGEPVVGAVVVPVWGVIGSADAASAGALDVPVGRIVGVTLVGLVVVVALGVGLDRTYAAPVAWALAVVALLVALVVGVAPDFAGPPRGVRATTPRGRGEGGG